MISNINVIEDITKLLAFLRVRAKGKVFKVDAELVKEVFLRLKKFAEEKNVTIEIIQPDGERIARFTKYGTFIGISLGYLFAGVPGVVVGGLLGAALGYACAHIDISMDIDDLGHYFLMKLI